MSSEVKPKHRINITHRTVSPEVVREELAKFEAKYGVTSTEFLRRFETGEMHQHGLGRWEFFCHVAKKMGVELR